MTVGIDTSVAVRLLIGEPVAQAEAARQLLDAHQQVAVTISDLVVGETYFVLRHHYAVPHGEAVATLRAFLADRRVLATGAALALLLALPDREAAPGFMDRLIHADYARDGSSLVTFDRSAAKLSGARLLGATRRR